MMEEAKISLIKFSSRCGAKLDMKSAEEILEIDATKS